MNLPSQSALAIIACALLACSESPKSEQVTRADVTFDISAKHLGEDNAERIIHAIRELAELRDMPIKVTFLNGAKAITFDVMLAEHQEDYSPKPIVQDADGKRLHPDPPAKPPGDLDPTWIRLTTSGTVIGDGPIKDSEFEDWLKFYAGAIGSIGERSAIVIHTDSDVSCGRLFDILTMQAAHGLDRFLIEKEAEQAASSNH